MIRRSLLTSLAIVIILLGGTARAQESQPVSLGTPVYDPHSKRYFALMRASTSNYGHQWDKVARTAQQQSYKGVKGRLAIVDSLEVHEFLLQTFPTKLFENIWIGLKYNCRARQLVWSDGHPFKRGDFQAWDVNWKQDQWFCSAKADPNDWAPIAYSMTTLRWIAKGREKGYEGYFIEFPTGHP